MAGVPLLCCRGSHRKLERAKWNARAYLGAFDHQQQEEDQDVTHQESLSTLEDGDTSTGTQTLGGTTTQSKQVYYLEYSMYCHYQQLVLHTQFSSIFGSTMFIL
jgi:hypothetical protein